MATIELRCDSAGKKTYRVKIRLRGHPPESATFRRLTDARMWEQRTEAAIREGRYFKTAESRRHTVADLTDRYILEALPHRPRNAQNTERHLRWWKARLGHMVLADVTPSSITECRDELLRMTTRRGTVMSPSTVVRHMAALSHVFTIAVRDWGWIEDSPMRRVTKPRQPRGHDRFLSDEERSRLLTVCKNSSSPYLYLAVVLALSTGMRRGEIMSLRWPAIDLPRNRILLSETKNDTPRSVPVAGHAHQLLEQLHEHGRHTSDLLFPSQGPDPNKPIDLKKAWSKAVREAGLQNFRFHDLRHSAASYLAMGGASTLELAAVLGHKTLQMVKRYAHLSDAHLLDRVAGMNERMFSNVKDSTDGNAR